VTIQRYSMDLDGYGYVEVPDPEGEYVKYEDVEPLLDNPRQRRMASIARSVVNLHDCPKCKLPKVDGLVCFCGYDGSYDV
jgi:ribosomal protein L32